MCVIPCRCGVAVEGSDAARSCARVGLAGHCGVRRHGSARASPVGYTVSSATAVALGTQPARAEMPQHKPPLYGQRRRRMRHRQGDDGRVRPPMRQPCARPRTSRSLSRAPARVMLRRRAVRSLVQHAAHVRGADGPLPSLGVPLTARAVTRVSMRGRRGLRHSTAVHRADLASTASGTMQLSQVCGAGVCRHVLPANAACGGYDCFRR